MDSMEFTSIFEPAGRQSSTCGYCSPPGQLSETTYYLLSMVMHHTAQDYQQMIDRGWRRSGTYIYKPDLRRSCCPQYTIKLDALEFSPTKSHRKVVSRWNRYVASAPESQEEPQTKKRTSGKRQVPFSLTSEIHASESAFSSNELHHRFEVTLEPSAFTSEKFELYEDYQDRIHNDPMKSPQGFKRFLVDTPLVPEKISYVGSKPAHLPENYGSYHQLYRLDGKLIAMAVLDILPHCVSSVYFMYNDDWDKYSLGKLSALREASLAREIHDCGLQDMKYLYMGFYIHSCQKMRYKGEYQPSYLLDPVAYSWHPLSFCVPLLERARYACFSQPEHSLHGDVDPKPNEEGARPEIMSQVHVLEELSEGHFQVLPFTVSNYWHITEYRTVLTDAAVNLGSEVTTHSAFYL